MTMTDKNNVFNIRMYAPLSPDDYPMQREGNLCFTCFGALRIIANFIKRYEPQGYYSTTDRKKIPLDEIKYHCRVHVFYMSLYEILEYYGIQIGQHESDLYFPKTKQTEKILSYFSGYEKTHSVFIEQESRKPWYEVPFAYDPYWRDKQLKEQEEA